MKIIHINFSLTVGGIETMLVDIANEQAKTNDVTVYIINNVYSNALLGQFNSNVRVRLFDRKPGSWGVRALAKLLHANFECLRLHPDVIHCHEHNVARVITAFPSRRVLTVHDTGYPVANMTRYKRVFAISNAVRHDVISRSNVDPLVIQNGINFQSVKIQRDWEWEGRILQVSRLEHEKKGQDILLEAISLLKREYGDNITVDFVGAGSSLDFLKALSVQLGISEHVRFLGEKGRDFIYDNMCNYDLVVQPSRYEGFGLTVIEAMAAKVPVLTSNIEGPYELIQGGEYGYSFAANSSRSLADTIHSISRRAKSKIAEKCERAYEYARLNYSVEETASKYIQAYKSLRNMA